MPLWLSVALPIVVSVLTVMANAVVNMKIKFAPSADAAARDLKQLLLRVAQWTGNLFIVGVLADNVFSSEPLTRVAAFSIAIEVAALMLVTALAFIKRINGHVKELVDMISLLNDAQTHHFSLTKKVTETLAKQLEGESE